MEELLAIRGVVVSYETIRMWCLKFPSAYTKKLRKSCGEPGDTWYLDEVFIKIYGVRHYLWKAADQDGNQIDILVQRRRNKKSALHFFRNLFRRTRATASLIPWISKQHLSTTTSSTQR